ncbi:hypothetical protein CH373_06070 [Leptospira perolatii]|uniref:Uncharacterized protein n=1 Tax=Leptospira perolatii TaxID=2023191 RepID=A0A2M9ZP24_9LEPT|nr:hypothetical protein CH360_04800 [Leptospira perolatii]PJZ73729.1 hypothetical protein CH373_06070 [Leptospira perolatii]
MASNRKAHPRVAFEKILSLAVHSSFQPEAYSSEEEWRKLGADTDVRLQWDPDHSPAGAPLERRAIQLGLRGDTLRSFATEWVLQISDISPFVRENHRLLADQRISELMVPVESVLTIEDSQTAARIFS